MKKHIATTLVSFFLLAACAANNSSDWDNLDYAKIARENYRRENDPSYTAPTITNCVDDDLYNCSGRR